MYTVRRSDTDTAGATVQRDSNALTCVQTVRVCDDGGSGPSKVAFRGWPGDHELVVQEGGIREPASE